MVASGELAAARYHYAGSVYRLPASQADEPIEFSQAGFEWFGGGGADEDAQAANVALGAAQTGGVDQAVLTIGDVALYRAVVDALAFSPLWKERLKRAFARRRGPKDLLKSGAAAGARSSALAQSLSGLSEADAGRVVEEVFAQSGVQVIGGRSAAEIAARLQEVSSERAPDSTAANLLVEWLGLRADAAASPAAISAFASKAGIDITTAVEAFAARIDRLGSLKPAFWKTAVFSAEAGRRFEYYDGFVFELTSADAPDRPIAAGGRYDGLIARLSGQTKSAAAIGSALRIDRLKGGKA
jgi:ATP phosphoribosyltransferase regulatory subunit